MRPFFLPTKRKRHASLRGVTRLSGLTTCLAPISSGHLVFKVYLAGDSNQPHPLRDSPLTSLAPDSSSFRSKFFVLRCTAERNSYPPRHALGNNLGMSRFQPWAITPIAQVPQPRSDFTNCRVERLPSRTFVFDLPRRRIRVRGFSSGLPRAEPLLAPSRL